MENTFELFLKISKNFWRLPKIFLNFHKSFMKNALCCFASGSPLDVLVRWRKKYLSYLPAYGRSIHTVSPVNVIPTAEPI